MGWVWFVLHSWDFPFVLFIFELFFELSVCTWVVYRLVIWNQDDTVWSDGLGTTNHPKILFFLRNSYRQRVQSALKNYAVAWRSNFLRLSKGKCFNKHGTKVHSWAYFSWRIDTFITLIGLLWILNNNKHWLFFPVQSSQNTLNNIMIVFIGLIGISYPMESHRPLSRFIGHSQPCVISIIEHILHLYSISFALNRLIVRPISSELYFLLWFRKLYKAFLIKIFRRQLELSKERLDLYIFVNIVLQVFA